MKAEMYRVVFSRFGGICQGCFQSDTDGITVRPIDMRRDVQNLDKYGEHELTLYCNDCAFRFLNYLQCNKNFEARQNRRKEKLDKRSLEEKRKRTLENLDALRRSTIPTIGDTMKGSGKIREATKPRSKK